MRLGNQVGRIEVPLPMQQISLPLSLCHLRVTKVVSIVAGTAASSKAAKSKPVEIEEGTLAGHTWEAIVHIKGVAVSHNQEVVNHTLGATHIRVAASPRWVAIKTKGVGWRLESEVVLHTWMLVMQMWELLLAFGLRTMVESVTAIELH